MLMRYGRAALLAALATLMGTTVWAQDYLIGVSCSGCCQKAKACNNKGCCATGACCKDGTCCKDGQDCCNSKKCDTKSTCCKDNKCECGKGGDCCCKDGKCTCKDKGTCSCKDGKCCKDNKCDCGKGGECCCKDGKCNCKDKTVTKMSCGCPFLNQLAKSTAIIMVMPSSLPLLGACHPGAMGMLPHPPMPLGPQVMLPGPMGPLPPPPPMLTPPGLPVPTMTSPIMPPQTIAMPVPPPTACCPCPGVMPIYVSKPTSHIDTCMQLLDVASELCYLMHPKGPSLCGSVLELVMMGMCPTMDARTSGSYQPGCVPPPAAPPRDLGFPIQEAAEINPNCCGMCGKIVATGQPVVSCAVAAPAAAAKVRIIATPSGSDLEMNVGEETCIHCKKMTVTIGDNEILVSRFDDRVRVRGEELKATADSVRSDRKDRIILEGDVVLHYKKDGHSANVTGDRIEVNLSSGAVTIKPAAKPATRPAARVDQIYLNQ